jgi:glycerol-3-phosphate dehydrogenase subunit B
MLTSAIEKQHGSINNGMLVSSASVEDHRVSKIWSEASARQLSHTAKNYILATGGILGGGINVDSHGYAKEMIFNFPIKVPQSRMHQFQEHFLSRESHPIHLNGLNVDPELHPINGGDNSAIENLFAVGSIVGNCDPVRELSLEGIALATGYKVAESLNSVS